MICKACGAEVAEENILSCPCGGTGCPECVIVDGEGNMYCKSCNGYDEIEPRVTLAQHYADVAP